MVPEFNVAAFTRLWNDHSIPTARIATVLGMTRQGVSWHAHHMGLPTRARLRRKKHDPALLAEMWLAGVSSHEIAAHFGMAYHSCATQAARALGLPRRVRGKSGKRNGGWMANLPITAFFEAKLAAKMAEAARIEQSALANAEMVDGLRPGRRAA